MTKHAVRLLAAVVVVGVLLAIVLVSQLDGTLSGRRRSGGEDYYALAVFAVVVVGAALPVVQRPTVGRTGVWALACWGATIGYFMFVEPLHPMRRPFDAAMSLVGLLAMVGSVVATFALRAAELPFDPSEPVLAHRMRSLFRVMLAIAGALSIVAFFPGYDEGGETGMAGGPFVFLVLLVALSPIQIAYRTPRRRPIWAWSLWIVLGSALLGFLALGVAIEPGLFSQADDLWAKHAVLVGLGMLACLLIAMPLVLATSRDDKVPRARVAA